MAGKGWWIGAALLVLVLALGGWLLIDEPLKPQARAWLNAVQERTEGSSVSYELLMGLNAPLAADPRELGRQRMAAYLARQSGVTELAIDEPRPLRSADLEVLCAPAQADCFARFQQDPGQAQRLLDEHGELLRRYREVLELGDFRTLLLPAMDEPLPPYALMAKGNRLVSLQALLLAQAGDGRGARRLLENDLKQLRQLLADGDQLVAKMLWLTLVAGDLDLLARLHAEGLLDRLREQPALSVRERDLLPALQREFAGVARHLLHLPDSAEAREEYSPVLLKLLYKPRQTVNLQFARNERYAELAGLDAAAFAEQVRRQPKSRSQKPWERPNNPLGVILSNIAGPATERYIARLHDLDAKLRLFNLLARLPAGEAPSADWLAAQADAGNPYAPGSPPQLAKQGSELCFSGPLQDERGLRCLPLRGLPAAAEPAS